MAADRDRAILEPHNRALLPEVLPGLPEEVALGEDPAILAAVCAVWLDADDRIAERGPDGPQDELTGTREPPRPPEALEMATRDLGTLESGLDDVHKALLRVPRVPDSVDPGDVYVEHLLDYVAHALHKLMLARMSAEHGMRMVGRNP